MSNTTMSVCIMSGKGGVGKTNITLNIAYALQHMGYPSILMDCDMGLANLDVLLGITPEKTMQDALLGHCEMKDVIHKVETGLDILPAASGMPDLVELDVDQREILLKRINPLLGEYHYVFMDLGAGITDMVQAFAVMAAVRIVVITPEPTSLTDSYALMKILHSNHGVRDFMVIVNQVENAKEEKKAFDTLQMACKRFLGIEPQLLGSVRFDPKLMEAVRQQKAFLTNAHGSPAGVDFQEIAKKIQQIRLSMLDELENRNVLQIPQE